jgi:hypothetical protein
MNETSRQAKLLRLARISRFIDKYLEDMRDFYAALSLMKTICLTLAMAHMTACAWHFVGHDADFSACSDTGLFNCTSPDGMCSWLDHTTIDQCTHPADNLSQRYIMSLYWATTTLSTVGGIDRPAPPCSPDPQPTHSTALFDR